MNDAFAHIIELVRQGSDEAAIQSYMSLTRYKRSVAEAAIRSIKKAYPNDPPVKGPRGPRKKIVKRRKP